jgi:hypothetical protein
MQPVFGIADRSSSCANRGEKTGSLPDDWD